MSQSRFLRSLAAVAVVLIIGGFVCAQWRGYDRGRGRTRVRSRTVPMWDMNKDFANDVFTFARVRYSSYGRQRWAIDYPSSDLNFSFRLQQLTSLKVNPEPVVVDLTDEEIFDYPFLYLIEPGEMELREAEVVGLRRYLLNGGFLMVDDFWGEYEYQALHRNLKRVFPNREAKEVPLEHEIFNCVYKLKEKPQVPSKDQALWGRSEGRTWEDRWDSDTSTPYYKAITDDKGRIMVFICHNTDLGDGWEREGDDEWYFQEFSVKKAYPLGINIVTYAMTH